MNRLKKIESFCVASLCALQLCGQGPVAVENKAVGAKVTEEKQNLQPSPVAFPVPDQPPQPSMVPQELTMPQDLLPSAGPSVEEVQKVQTVEPEVPVIEMPQSPKPTAPSVPITRILPPKSRVPQQEQGQSPQTKVSLDEQQAGSKFAMRSDHLHDDSAALENLAVRSHDVKKHLSVPPPDEDDERIDFQFENTDLKNVIQQVGDLFNVTFVTDDIINPLPQGAAATTGSKISFRTQKSMTKKQAWNMFLSFLDIAGFAVVPEKSPRRYRIVALQKALKAAEPVYIGVDPVTLPDNDQIIRFVYFVENGNMAVIQSVVNKLRSSTSDLVSLGDAKAFILTDKSYNIKTLMVIVKELDRVSMPQSMSVMKLYRADAKDVKALFDQLMGTEESKQQPMFMPPRQQPTALYFAANTRLIAEPRTNSLIILGTPESIEKIENFIRKNVDKDPDTPHSPLFYYDLKFADARTVKKILEDTVGKFGTDTEAGKVGGIRGIDKYIRPMAFIDDPATNRIIMKGDYQDYIMVKDLIAQIDQPQPQAAIEVLVLLVSWSKIKQLGTQIRNYMKACGGFGSENIQFQTSGLAGNSGIVERRKPNGSTESTIPNRLMGNLLDLVTGLASGNTIITLGRDIFGVWGIIQMLESFVAAETVANPFLLAANKQKAVVEVGEIRRVITSEIVQNASQSTPTFDDMKATLKVEVTPQINSDGMITLDILVSIVNFLAGSTAETVAQETREITTKAIVTDREVLALGGLIRNNSNQNLAKVPLLSDVPLLGWLFKNESRTDQRDCLLILFSTQIIDPLSPTAAARFTRHHIDDYYGTLDTMIHTSERRDPIYRMFFKEDPKSVGNRVQDFIFEKPKKRTKKAQAELEELKKEHPVLADQPEVLETFVSKKEKLKEKNVVKIPVTEEVKQAPMNAVANNNASKRRAKVSLTHDILDNQEMA